MIETTCVDFLKEESSDLATYEEAQRKMEKLYSDLESCYWVDEGNDVREMRETAIADTTEMMTEMKRKVYRYLPHLPRERSSYKCILSTI